MSQPNRRLNKLASSEITAVAVLAALVVGVIVGCTNNDSGSGGAAPNAPRPVTSAPSGTPVRTDATRLKEGPAPLTYMLGPGGSIRFVDTDTGKTVATTTAPQQAIISIDEAKGISVANKIVKAGPLPAGHRYELWLDRK